MQAANISNNYQVTMNTESEMGVLPVVRRWMQTKPQPGNCKIWPWKNWLTTCWSTVGHSENGITY